MDCQMRKKLRYGKTMHGGRAEGQKASDVE